MELRSSALKSIQSNIDSIQIDYTNKRIDDKGLANEARKLSAELQSQITQANSQINMAKYPRGSKGYSPESLRLSELTKQRAVMMIDKPLSLIKSEIIKEADTGNYDFCFTLCELIFASDRPDSIKALLSNTYKKLKDVTKVTEYEDEKNQALILQRHVNAMVEFEGTENLLTKAAMIRSQAEIKYTRAKDNDATAPEFQKFREAQGIDALI
jgi:hypothetical protein